VRGRGISYSEEELAWLEERQDWPRAALHSAFIVLFDRRGVSFDALKALCARRGWSTGRTGCFVKGAVPANKGKPCPEGTGGKHPNARRTQFKKGSLNGVSVKLYKPIGSERLSKEGYLERKIHDGLPKQSRWRAVHLIEWERVNGPLPAGHCLKSLDGSRSNLDPANWQLISRAVLLRLNGGPHGRHLAYHQAAPEIRPVILTMAKVAQRSRELDPRKPQRAAGGAA
jgi:hypothetical protein